MRLQDHVQAGSEIPGRPSAPARRGAAVWMSVAFGAALAMAVGILVSRGAGVSGVDAALRATARLGFAFFWLSYAGGALVALFGPAFDPVKRRGREFGLAFACVLVVHLCLVGWRCWIGAAPSVRTFAIFGAAAICTGLLALFSTDRLGKALGAKGWWTLRNVGLNYITFAFAFDFLRPGRQMTGQYLLEYLPFATLVVLGPVLRLLAWLKADLAPRPPRAARPRVVDLPGGASPPADLA